MSIKTNLNNVMVYDIVTTSMYIWKDFQKHWVRFALDALGESSFWRECPFIPWHINIFNKHHNIHRSFCANHNTHQNSPCLLRLGCWVGRSKMTFGIFANCSTAVKDRLVAFLHLHWQGRSWYTLTQHRINKQFAAITNWVHLISEVFRVARSVWVNAFLLEV